VGRVILGDKSVCVLKTNPDNGLLDVYIYKGPYWPFCGTSWSNTFEVPGVLMLVEIHN
jgi:hypothetical protein